MKIIFGRINNRRPAHQLASDYYQMVQLTRSDMNTPPASSRTASTGLTNGRSRSLRQVSAMQQMIPPSVTSTLPADGGILASNTVNGTSRQIRRAPSSQPVMSQLSAQQPAEIIPRSRPRRTDSFYSDAQLPNLTRIGPPRGSYTTRDIAQGPRQATPAQSVKLLHPSLENADSALQRNEICRSLPHLSNPQQPRSTNVGSRKINDAIQNIRTPATQSQETGQENRSSAFSHYYINPHSPHLTKLPIQPKLQQIQVGIPSTHIKTEERKTNKSQLQTQVSRASNSKATGSGAVSSGQQQNTQSTSGRYQPKLNTGSPLASQNQVKSKQNHEMKMKKCTLNKKRLQFYHGTRHRPLEPNQMKKFSLRPGLKVTPQPAAMPSQNTPEATQIPESSLNRGGTPSCSSWQHQTNGQSTFFGSRKPITEKPSAMLTKPKATANSFVSKKAIKKYKPAKISTGWWSAYPRYQPLYQPLDPPAGTSGSGIVSRELVKQAISQANRMGNEVIPAQTTSSSSANTNVSTTLQQPVLANTSYRCQSSSHSNRPPNIATTCIRCGCYYTVTCENICSGRFNISVAEAGCPRCWNSNSCYCGQPFSDRYVNPQ